MFSLAETKRNAKRSAGRPKASDARNLPEVILVTAIKLFSERGPEKVMIKDIAAEANVASSLVHHHFGKRAELREACSKHVLETIQTVISAIEKDLPTQVSPSDLDQLGNALITGLRERVFYLRFLALLFFEGDDEAKKVFQDYFNILHQVTLRYEQAGLLRSDLNPVWVTTQLIYSQLGTVYLQGPLAEIIGQDPYSRQNSTERTKTFIQIAKSGMFKDRTD